MKNTNLANNKKGAALMGALGITVTAIVFGLTTYSVLNYMKKQQAQNIQASYPEAMIRLLQARIINELSKIYCRLPNPSFNALIAEIKQQHPERIISDPAGDKILLASFFEPKEKYKINSYVIEFAPEGIASLITKPDNTEALTIAISLGPDGFLCRYSMATCPINLRMPFNTLSRAIRTIHSSDMPCLTSSPPPSPSPSPSPSPTPTPTSTVCPGEIINPNFPKSCLELKKLGNNVNGNYTVYPDGTAASAISVYCDMTTDGGGWQLFIYFTSGGYSSNRATLGTTKQEGNVIASKPANTISRVAVTGNTQVCSAYGYIYDDYWESEVEACIAYTNQPFSFDMKESGPSNSFQPSFNGAKQSAGSFNTVISQTNAQMTGTIGFSTEIYGGAFYAMLNAGGYSTIGSFTYALDQWPQGIWWAIRHDTPVYGYYCRNTMDICCAIYPNNTATGNTANELAIYHRKSCPTM